MNSLCFKKTAYTSNSVQQNINIIAYLCLIKEFLVIPFKIVQSVIRSYIEVTIAAEFHVSACIVGHG